MRKYSISFTLLCGLLSIAFISCKKEGPAEKIVSSLTLVNAVPDINTSLITDLRGGAKTNFIYSSALKLRYGIYDPGYKLSVEREEQPFTFYIYPDTTASSKPFIDLKLQFNKGSINSLFLTGIKSNPDYMLATAVPPYHNQTDSTLGIRFTNLSYQSKPVSVYVITSTEQKELEGLTYKGITDYRKYAVLSNTKVMRFEFRDQETQKVLASYSLGNVGSVTPNQWRYRNFTLALIGLPGSTDPVQKQNTMCINDY